jgi:predicted ATPase
LDGAGDGVWLVELAAISDPDLIAPSISDALGLLAQPGRPPLDALIDALAVQDMLIVLDNCEHLIEACAKTADTILRGCPNVHLLVTSREPLGIDGETIYRVPSLSLPDPATRDFEAASVSDALDLFMDRARAQGIDVSLAGGSGRIVASICRRLDGMPLAIELAVARLRSMSLADLSDRLDQRFKLLTGGSRSALERQQTLRATVEWSYSLLTDLERSVLRRLSVFLEGFELDAAEQVCCFDDIEAFEIDNLVGSLVDKSLVQADPAGERVRYRLLETIRQFAAGRLVEAGETEPEAVAAAHCRYYLSVAEEASEYLSGPSQARWLARLDDDEANLRQAFEHAANDPTMIEQTFRFAVALKRYWVIHPRDDEVRALLSSVLDQAHSEADPQLVAGALVVLAMACRFADVETKLAVCGRAVEVSRRIENTPLLVEALIVQSMACAFTGDRVAGLPYGKEAITLSRSIGDDVLLAQSVIAYTLCLVEIDPVEAERLYEEGIGATVRSGDRFFNLMLHNNAGVLALVKGDLALARIHFEEGAQAREASGATGNEITNNLGWVFREEGDHARSRSEFARCLQVSRQTGDPYCLAYSVLGFACTASDEGEWERASTLHGLAQSFLDRIGTTLQPPESSYCQASLVDIVAHLGQQHFDRLYTEAKALSLDAAMTSVLDELAQSNQHTEDRTTG